MNLSPDVLIGRFKQLENDVGRLRPYIKAELDKYRQALNAHALQRRGQRRRLSWERLGNGSWFELPFARNMHPTV